jgi:serine phosphatase RsbU (regulator of sigma subunit)
MAKLKEIFIFYQPKEIVSGDFYWYEQNENLSYIAVVDCTGHGVPGAFISIVSCNCLYQASKEKRYSNAAEMLNRVQELFNATIKQTYEESTVKDGMDISLCIIDSETKTIDFAGANHDLHLVRNNEMIEFKGDKRAIGIFIGDDVKAFTTTKIQLQQNDAIYLFTDGFADQFGGETGEQKYFRKRLKKYLTQISAEPIKQQKRMLKTNFNDWKGNREQVDDVLVIGIKF